MMHRGFACSLALAVICTSGAYAANCAATFTASQINVTYDPLGEQGSSQVVTPVTLSVARRNASIASVRGQFMDQQPGALRVGRGGPFYVVSDRGNNVSVPQGAIFNPSFSFSHTFTLAGANKPETVSGIQLLIDAGQDVAAGIYGENLDIQYQCSNASSTLRQSAVLPITVHVPSTLIANLAGGSASGTIDFGTFSEPSKTVQVNVYSTGPYALSIASANNAQAMKLANAPAAAASAASARIAYTMNFAGSAVSTATTVHFPRSGVGGAHLPFSVTTESVAGKRAGVYRDTITLTFTPLATL